MSPMTRFSILRFLLFALAVTAQSVAFASSQIRFSEASKSDDKLVETVAAVESLYGGASLEEIKITMGGTPAQANVYLNEIVTGTSEVNRLSRAILIHEIGHIVFWRNRNRLLNSEHLQALEQMGEAIRMSDEMMKRFEKNSGNSFKKLCGAQQFGQFNREINPFPKFGRLCDRIKRQFELVDKRFVETHRERKLIAPYDEFFADLLAVLTLNDPESISRDTRDGLRSFAGNPVEAHDKEQFLQAIHCDAHTFFRSARPLVWRQYQIWGANRESARRVLAITIRAIGKEIKRRSLDPAWVEQSKESVDLSFLQTLSEEFRLVESEPASSGVTQE